MSGTGSATDLESEETWAGEWAGVLPAEHASAQDVVASQLIWHPLPALSLPRTYVLLTLFGLLGAHQFYLRNRGRGFFYLLTAGGLGIGLVIDLCTVPRQLRAVNAQRALGLR